MLSLISMPDQSHVAEFALQRAATEPQESGGRRAIVVGAIQGNANESLFHFLEIELILLAWAS